MKNLILSQVSSKKQIVNSDEKFFVGYGYPDESTSGNFFVCSKNGVVSSFNCDGVENWSTALSNTASDGNSPVNVTFLGLSNSVSVGLSNGELFTISDFGATCDLAGVCDNGLLAMEWSPDQELLALVTKDLKLILMSCTFDPVNEYYLLSEDFGEKQFINVGWGKKETQFHGSEGKQAAKATTAVIGGKLSACDTRIIISWRGDGNLFAVGFTMDAVRRFKIFDREGNSQYTSELQSGLEANLSWRPSGNLIATTQKLPDKYLVTFFEKNGLKHGEFIIPVDITIYVEDIFWSSDSEILTLLCRDTTNNTQQVLLFTSSNYHWYLKQTLHFNKINIADLMWDNDFNVTNNKKMHVTLDNGQYYGYTWKWEINHSIGKSSNDDAVVSVIDGKKLFLTAFRYSVVPPPMSGFTIEFESHINSVHFAPDSENLNSNNLFVCTDEKLVFLEQTNKNPLDYKITKTLDLENFDFPYKFYNFHWFDSETVLCVSIDDDNNNQIIQYKLSETLTISNSQLLPSALRHIRSNPVSPTSVYLQLESGDILQYNSDNTIIPQDISLPEACPEFSVVSVDNEIYFLGLSYKGYFYINDKLVLNNVSSFYVHTNYLLLTTLKHTLLCIELAKEGLNGIEMYDKSESDIYRRKVERGSKLVIAVPQDTRTVLQMPRGNLETINPRPLSLRIIGEYLDCLKYYEAFDLMRKQRINLNLIYDHNTKLFTDNINVFLENIKNNSWLSLFLSDLENADVTRTMYSSSYPNRRNISNEEDLTKIHRVCDILKSNLIKAHDSADRILPLLTTFVKKNTANDLEEALTLIKELKIKESSGSKLPVPSDDALKYLLYMVNVDQLFDVALGMYDFELVLLVAAKSQKDPKEYIPMLNELNEMEGNYRRFTINKHLKRFHGAVLHLAKCGPSRHDELKTFVKYHSLYREALELFTEDDEIYKQISDDFGSYLKLKKQYIEAGIVYESAKNIDKAIECYKEALEWELVLNLAQNKSRKDLKDLCWDLANSLKNEKRYTEALQILDVVSDDGEDIINLAVECAQYKTALRMCTKYNKRELVESKLLPSLVTEYHNTKDLLNANLKSFIGYRSRLLVVREVKSRKNYENYESFGNNRDSDLYSDTGSTIASSSGSGRSFRSSKNRRKHQRKIASLKEGSRYEDTALVLALHTLVTSTYDLRSPIKELNIALSCFGKNREALDLQCNLENLLQEMKNSFKQIWSNNFTLEATNAAIEVESVPDGSVIPLGIAALEPKLRIAPVIPDVQWRLEGLN